MNLMDIIVCDDVREEKGNKFTLVGVYSDALVINAPVENINTWPKAMRLGFFVRLNLQETGAVPDGFSIKFNFNGKEIAKGEGDIIMNDKASILSVALPPNIFPFPSEGILGFVITLLKSGNVIHEIIPNYKLKISVNKLAPQSVLQPAK